MVKLQAKLEIGDKYATLYAVVEGLFKLGFLNQEDHDLLIQRYSHKLVEVVKEKRAKRENSHIPVVELEKRRKEQLLLDQKDKYFKDVLEQWTIHPSQEWRLQKIGEAQKFQDKLQSARDVAALKECDIISPALENEMPDDMRHMSQTKDACSARYQSLHQCPKCQGKLIWDSIQKTLTCLCGTTRASFVNLSSFQEVSK